MQNSFGLGCANALLHPLWLRYWAKCTLFSNTGGFSVLNWHQLGQDLVFSSTWSRCHHFLPDLTYLKLKTKLVWKHFRILELKITGCLKQEMYWNLNASWFRTSLVILQKFSILTWKHYFTGFIAKMIKSKVNVMMKFTSCEKSKKTN